ncbi:MAG: hypothetical protein J6T57_01940 [Alphaproteobacteria bacterium]|nr:hypothetical protein [Alphaproteobacteria bacterium]
MERKISSTIFVFAMFLPCVSLAAGTYYNGNYSSPQRNYATAGYAARAQNTSYSQNTTYSRTRTVNPNANAYVGQPYQNYTRVTGVQNQTNNTTQTVAPVVASKSDSGLSLNAGISHEFATWNFDMNSAGSKLHYDNIRWNVFDVTAAYKFGAGGTPMQIDAGFKYGIQFGESTMIDDDISNGGYIVTEWNDWHDADGDGQIDQNELTYLGAQMGHSLSIGESSGGDMMGFHAGFGLTDFFKVGGARITPSIGYRYLKYKLETKSDYGLTIDTGSCESLDSGESQCDPIVVFYNVSGNTQEVMWDHIAGTTGELIGSYWYWQVPSGSDYITTAGTYMFRLPGTSHSYETTWMGPYLALDLNYDINVYNMVNARVEFGLPAYESTGDQPYRSDWQHPKSVEDKGGFGDAWHIGLGANYMTALTESVYLTLGFSFDYYTLSGGDATTYLNGDYYMDIYNDLLAEYQDQNPTMTQSEIIAWMDANDPVAMNIRETQAECPGWVCKADSEIESIYKSLGMHIGIRARF